MHKPARRLVRLSLIPVVLAVVLTACGDKDPQEAAPADPAAAAGQAISREDCSGCHSSDGTDGSGPTFKGLYNAQRTLEGGPVVTADDAYLTAAIRDPDAQIVDGYDDGVMSAVIRENEISPEETQQLIAYIRSLGA